MDKNLLRDRDLVLAIDPMPHVGDPHSDIGFSGRRRAHPPPTSTPAQPASPCSLIQTLIGRASGRPSTPSARLARGGGRTHSSCASGSNLRPPTNSSRRAARSSPLVRMPSEKTCACP
jgi:hypothetical protein